MAQHFEETWCDTPSPVTLSPGAPGQGHQGRGGITHSRQGASHKELSTATRCRAPHEPTLRKPKRRGLPPETGGAVAQSNHAQIELYFPMIALMRYGRGKGTGYACLRSWGDISGRAAARD